MVVVTVAAAEGSADNDSLILMSICFLRTAGADEGGPGVVDGILFGSRLLGLGASQHLGQFCGYFIHIGVVGVHSGADGSRDVIAAIDVDDEDVAGGMFTVEIDKCPATHVGHSCAPEDIVDLGTSDVYGGIAVRVALVATTIDAAANGDLGLGLGYEKCKEQGY